MMRDYAIMKHHLPVITERNISPLVGIGERIATARKEAGLTQDALAKIVSVGQSTVAQWETDTNEPSNDKLEKIAVAVRRTASWLAFGDTPPKPAGERTPVGNNQSMVGSANHSGLAFPSGAQTLHSWPKDLKIIGHVKAGVDGVFLDQGEIHGMAHRPPALSGVKDAFAVYVHDDSMFPAFEPGHVVWVHPHRPVRPGDNVIIEMMDGFALIKRLVRRTEKAVICQQWRPEKEVRYDSAKVKRLYYVVGSYKED
jgi:phage repressor protein C with HTH and peptisase S24 domain